MIEFLKRLLPYDKLLHLNAGAVFVYLLSCLCNDYLMLITGVVALGILKELYDKYIKKSKFDWWDVLYTLIGGILILLITWKC